MAIGASAVWSLRYGGSDLSGAAFDATISGAGTDYTQQDAAQASWTNLTTSGAGATTVTDSAATGLFTSAMIGNALRIPSATSGLNNPATGGYFFITAFTNGNNVVVDRAPGTAAALVGGGAAGTACKLGGGIVSVNRIDNSANGTGDKVVAGNTITVQGRNNSTLVVTTLSAAITTTNTTGPWTVASASGFPGSGNFYVRVDSEILLVTAGQGTTSWTMSRAQGGTTGATHSNGAAVTLVDYVIGINQYNPPVGDSTSGPILIQPLSGTGRPHICFLNRWHDGSANYWRYRDLIFSGCGSGVALINMGSYSQVTGSLFHLFGNAAAGLWMNTACDAVDNEFYGGSTAPSGTAQSAAILSNGVGLVIRGNFIHGFATAAAVDLTSSTSACFEDNIVARNSTDGLRMTPQGDRIHSVRFNTFDNNGGNGLVLNYNSQGTYCIEGNIFSNHTGGSKAGLSVAGAASQAFFDSFKRQIDYNAYYNNTANYSGVSGGSHDTTGVDPTYTDNASYAPPNYPDYRIGTNLKGLGPPQTTPSGQRSYADPGALQRQEAAGGGGLAANPIAGFVA